MLAARHFLRRTFSSALATHRDTAYNNRDTPFDFTEENYQKITTILTHYPPQYKRSATINLLYLAQKQCDGWVPLAAMNKIAKILEISEMDVYEVCSFYTMFNREPVGKYHLQVCGTTPCMIRGAQDIIKTIEHECGIIKDQTSKDGLFTLTEVECLGCCANAPMLQVNGEKVYEDLTPETMKAMIDAWKAGKEPKVGPQNGRTCAEGIQGRTTLKAQPNVWPDRDFAKAKDDYQKRLEAEAQKKKEEAAAAAAKK
ncbi:unnamed protein product [Blepharisma stoltei]|uniref:NADH dehydrogenase [ubiquinone] flavoprotein 2, mitochondrial n=1 Tax=Blepharisma stoltei TaxID=1481888 RepID=A0AAU9K2C4_9CILI|nr:unnamed protein product [Blepharisma stoltei]